MEQKNEEELCSPGESSFSKSKKDWSHLNDIETLISEMNKGKKLRCIVYDTETTGVNFKKDHILELACVELVNFTITGRNFHIYIKPRVFVPKNVQELNHIKYDDFRKYWEYYYQDTKAQLQNFLEFVGEDSYLVAHNATFDYYILNSELKYWGLPELSHERFRCTLRMVKKIFKSEEINLPNSKLFTCCEYFKILVNENEGSYHNALFDTIMTSKLLIHLYKKSANINDFENYNKSYKYSNNKKVYKPRYNKFDPENLNKVKENIKNEEKEDEKEEKVKNEKVSNMSINNNNKIENEENKEKKEIQNKPQENNNEITDGKINGTEIKVLIEKMNELLINKEIESKGK